jgi:predicted membrane channel-forming protein YqfA (hemolysin III family)
MIPHSEAVHKYCLSLDYLGIIYILFATTSILIYKCFYDSEYDAHKIVYILIMGVILYLLSTLIYTTNFISPEKKRTRIILFSLACLFTLIPVIHSGYIHSFNKNFIIILASVIVSIILISIGLYIYINRFPENKYKNELFNYIGNSHNIWHVMSVITLTVHFYAIKYVLKYLE